jgi:hypothetical protein
LVPNLEANLQPAKSDPVRQSFPLVGIIEAYFKWVLKLLMSKQKVAFRYEKGPHFLPNIEDDLRRKALK